MGDITEAKGLAENKLGLYTADDYVTGHWSHDSDITGFGTWDFGAEKREDIVKIYGNEGNISFSVFGEVPIVLERDDETTSLNIAHPEHIQWYHVQNLKTDLLGGASHPSTGFTAAQTAWAMDRILEKEIKVINN